nr:aminoglycoside phosphotransferase family protein [Streptomyces aureocirculatus]
MVGAARRPARGRVAPAAETCAAWAVRGSLCPGRQAAVRARGQRTDGRHRMGQGHPALRATAGDGSDHRLLHGDLHLGNVLDGGQRGLMAIDPKACAGDPCFDAVDCRRHTRAAGVDALQSGCGQDVMRTR